MTTIIIRRVLVRFMEREVGLGFRDRLSKKKAV